MQRKRKKVRQNNEVIAQVKKDETDIEKHRDTEKEKEGWKE